MLLRTPPAAWVLERNPGPSLVGLLLTPYQLSKDLSLVHSQKLFSTIANPIALYPQNALCLSLSSLLELNPK